MFCHIYGCTNSRFGSFRAWFRTEWDSSTSIRHEGGHSSPAWLDPYPMRRVFPECLHRTTTKPSAQTRQGVGWDCSNHCSPYPKPSNPCQTFFTLISLRPTPSKRSFSRSHDTVVWSLYIWVHFWYIHTRMMFSGDSTHKLVCSPSQDQLLPGWLQYIESRLLTRDPSKPLFATVTGRVSIPTLNPPPPPPPKNSRPSPSKTNTTQHQHLDGFYTNTRIFLHQKTFLHQEHFHTRSKCLLHQKHFTPTSFQHYTRNVLHQKFLH